MITLHNLPHTDGRKISTHSTPTPKQAVNKLTKKTPTSYAGDNGAFTLHWGDDNLWHGHHMAFLATVEERSFIVKGDIQDWIESVFEKIL